MESMEYEMARNGFLAGASPSGTSTQPADPRPLRLEAVNPAEAVRWPGSVGSKDFEALTDFPI